MVGRADLCAAGVDDANADGARVLGGDHGEHDAQREQRLHFGVLKRRLGPEHPENESMEPSRYKV